MPLKTWRTSLMHIFDNPLVMREIIMDHYKRPIFKKTPGNTEDFVKIHMDSPNCIDDITIFIRIEKEIVNEVYFDGIACAIATASTDIMCDMIKDKALDDAEVLIENYLNMLYEKPYDKEILGEAIVFINTSKQAARIKCATIGWDGLKKGIMEYNNGR